MVFKKASSIVEMNHCLFKIFEFEYINVIIISLGISFSKFLSSFSYSGIANYFELRALGKKIITTQLGMNHTFEVWSSIQKSTDAYFNDSKLQNCFDIVSNCFYIVPKMLSWNPSSQIVPCKIAFKPLYRFK